ncbi:MAG: LptF/LptG family permease [Pseudomonadota bacterium]
MGDKGNEMPLKLLERYILKRAFMSLLVASCALTGVVWVIKAFQEVDIITSKGQGVLLYLYITLLGVPTLAGAVIPISLLIAVVQTINTLNNDSELVVINASGASQAIVLKPFAVLAIITAAFVYFLALYAGPASLLQLRKHVTEINTDLVTVVLREGKFNSVSSGLTFHINSRAPGGTLEGVFVLDEREEKETFTYIAKQGIVVKHNDNSFLILRDGEIHRMKSTDKNASIIRFTSYAFNLTTLSASSKVTWSAPEEIPTSELINPDISNDYYKAKPGTYVSELHSRLTAGLYPFVFTAMVLAFAGRARSTRQSYGLAVANAAIICVVLRGASFAAVNSTRGAPDGWWVIWLIPMLGVAVPAAFLAMNKQVALPDFVRDRIDGMQIAMRRMSDNARLRARQKTVGTQT